MSFDVSQQERLFPAYLVEIGHATDPQYLWTGVGKMEYDTGDGEQTWLGCGGVGSISFPENDGQVSVKSVDLTLSGIDETSGLLIASEDVSGQSCKIWKVFLDNYRKIVKSDLVFDSVQEYLQFTKSDDGTASITLTCMDRMGYLAQQTTRTLSPEYLSIEMERLGIDPTTVNGADYVHTLPGDNRSWFPPA